MARFRKTLYLVVECGLLVILSATTGVLILRENVFRQLPLTLLAARASIAITTSGFVSATMP